MRLNDLRSVNFVDLSPIGYELSEPNGDHGDDNWLMIRGEVRSGVDQWSFDDPALLIEEARRFGLRALAVGRESSRNAVAHSLTETRLPSRCNTKARRVFRVSAADSGANGGTLGPATPLRMIRQFRADGSRTYTKSGTSRECCEGVVIGSSIVASTLYDHSRNRSPHGTSR